VSEENPDDLLTFGDEPLDWEFHGTPQTTREARLFGALRTLTEHHAHSGLAYRGVVDALFPKWREAERLADLPYVPIGLFKERRLSSFPDSALFKTITSSGTTGSAVSQVLLDRQTARRQTKALSITMQTVLGAKRRPMLLVDSDAVMKNGTSFSARGAGVIGMMSFGRSHAFLLDEDMRARVDRLREFLDDVGDQRPVLFGFTFMVWQHLYKELKDQRVDLAGATLVHSGGWKKLEEERVTNDEFKRCLEDAFGIAEVVNFYSMAEQVGSVFLEGADCLLHPAPFADVIIRDPRTMLEQPAGEPGIVQVVSAVPTGYPGHSILTEDWGVVETVDSPDTPHRGKAFRIIGRVPKAELRGCSDTYAEGFGG
jgi:acyl-CoA synthetase (AMP-forming)/AMP-acid ligase II